MPKPDKNERGYIHLMKWNLAPAMAGLKSARKFEEFQDHWDRELFGRCWRMVLGLNLKLEPRAVSKK